MDFRGHNAWGNLPFSDFLAILQNFLRCKRRQQNGTSGTFLVPCWEGNPGYELVKSLPEVFRVKRRWDARSTLFTAPSPEGGGRTFWGKTRFAVMVVHCPPGPVFWADSELTDEVLDRVEAFTAALQAEYYAYNTQCSYSTGVRSFVSFCIARRRRNFLDEMLPASDEVLAKWVVFMVTDQLVKPSTAKQYTSGVRALHLQLKFEWTPVRERWPVWAALQGCRKRWDTPSKQVMPVGFDELLLMQRMVDPNNLNQRADSFRCHGLVVVIRVRHSKTIQAGELYHTVSAHAVPGSPLCPVAALRHVLAGPGLGPEGPLFCTQDAKGKLKPLTHSVFVSTFRRLAQRAGLHPEAYSGHSFRRGGATT
eukprot:gene34538-biopygen32966